jgi:hypothetical protein
MAMGAEAVTGASIKRRGGASNPHGHRLAVSAHAGAGDDAARAGP